MSAGNILVVDDEPEIRRLVKEVLEDESYQVITADGADTAQDELEKLHADLVLLDIWMPNTDGMALLQKWADSGGLPCPVVMMSGHGNIETAVEALKLGAYDFIEKPVSMAKLLVTVQRALQTENLRKENLRLKRRTETGTELIAASPAMLQLKEDIERVAPTDFWVLISGEPGSGKAMAARYLHSHSTRKNGPLVEISLAATPKENMAIQLFGSGEGENVSPGSFEQAEGGILLLDEIGDLDLETQGRLVSALEDNRFIRVGGTTVIEMNVRIVATTQHDLAAEVKAGKFREDLFYRLNVVPLKVPPLRERLEDIEPLCRQYVDWLTEFEHLPSKHFSDQAINALKRYSWPGNVRELKNVIQRLMILCRNVEINAEDVRKAIGYDLGTTEEPTGNFDQTLRSARDEFERAYILYHLERNNGNVSALADRSGMERTHLYRKLKQLGINPKTLKNK
jgi:two-component system nitrogen regulation response regulator NtrX